MREPDLHECGFRGSRGETTWAIEDELMQGSMELFHAFVMYMYYHRIETFREGRAFLYIWRPNGVNTHCGWASWSSMHSLTPSTGVIGLGMKISFWSRTEKDQ